MIAGRNSQTFTADDTFIVPDGVYCIYFTGTGGGGAGTAGYNSTHTGGGLCGGGAGSYCTKVPIPVTPGEVVTITVGAGGFPAFTGAGGDTATHFYGQVNATNIGGSVNGTHTQVKNTRVDGGQTAFWGISFGHPWAGSGGGGGGSCGLDLGGPAVPGSMAGLIYPAAVGLYIQSGYGSHNHWGGSSGGNYDPTMFPSRNGFGGGGGPGGIPGGSGGGGIPFDGSNQGSGGGGGGASPWGEGGDGGTSTNNGDTSFHHDGSMDADSPSGSAYGAAGGGGANWAGAYGLGANGASGFAMISW